MKNTIKKITTVFSIALLFAMTAMPTFASHNDSEKYRANLQTLNDSGVRGNAKMTLDGNQLMVTINARGYEANKLHVQHIHGFDDKRNSVCPAPSADINNDGVVDLVEGLPSYGPVILNFEPFPTADSIGRVDFQNTYTIDVSNLGPLENRAIVLHGKTVNGTYDATLPVACGQIVMSHQGQDNGNGNGQNKSDGTSVDISGNGADSRNNVDINSSNTTNVSQNNDTRITNDVNSNVNTGNNRSSSNTGGHTFLNSGNAESWTSIFNRGGMNIAH